MLQVSRAQSRCSGSPPSPCWPRFFGSSPRYGWLSGLRGTQLSSISTPQDFFGRAVLHPYVMPWLILVAGLVIPSYNNTLLSDILNLTSFSEARSNPLFKRNIKRNVSEAGKKSNAWTNPAARLLPAVSRQVPLQRCLAAGRGQHRSAPRGPARRRLRPPPSALPSAPPLPPPPLRAEASRAAAVAAAAAVRPGAGMADGARSLLGGSPASSPVLGGRGRVSSSSSSSSPSAIPPGHSFRRVTLTKPTFCHYCTDFIWGLAGYQCEEPGYFTFE
uniref:Phorbol-ester/DAG-type domain-containing protein n=1 Tax=Phasianus colchicus TaxID=9054 RepID=A0A669QRA5_PHACC